MRKSLSGIALAVVAALALGMPSTTAEANGKPKAAKAKVMKKAKVAKIKKIKVKRVVVRKVAAKKRVAKVVVAHPHARIMAMLHVRPMAPRKHAKLAVWKKGKPGRCSANWAWVKSKRQCQDFRLK